MAVWSLASGVTPAQEPVVLKLATGASEIHGPRVASQGNFTSAVWVEARPDSPAVLRQANFRDSLITSSRSVVPRTVHLPEQGVPSDPVVAFCPLTGRPGLACVVTTDSGAAVVYHSPLGQPETIHRTTALPELPVLDFDEEGRAYLAWAEIDGGQSRIVVATRETDGWTVQAMSEGLRPYDVYPQLFGATASADLHWFSIDGNGVQARSVSLPVVEAAMEPATRIPFLPGNRLPALYTRTGEQTLGAWWLVQADRGEFYFALGPGAEGPVVLGDPQNLVESPTASVDGAGALAWLERTPAGERLLAVDFAGGQERFAVDRSATEPAVSRSEYYTHVLWVETPLGGDSARLLYRRHR